jgi:hypothetical protein
MMLLILTPLERGIVASALNNEIHTIERGMELIDNATVKAANQRGIELRKSLIQRIEASATPDQLEFALGLVRQWIGGEDASIGHADRDSDLRQALKIIESQVPRS